MKLDVFYRRRVIKRFIWFGVMLLALAIVAEFFIHLHAYFAIAKFFSFNAIFGFLSCVVMVAIAKLIGVFIKRKDDYYDL